MTATPRPGDVIYFPFPTPRTHADGPIRWTKPRHWPADPDFLTRHAPAVPVPAPPADDARPVLVVGACHDCDTRGPVVLIPTWEQLHGTEGQERPVRGLDTALCHLCAGNRLAGSDQ